MIDPITLNRLSEVVHHERIEAATKARHQHATWVIAPSATARARLALGTWLIKLGEWVQTPATRSYSAR